MRLHIVDTHVLLWFVLASSELGKETLRLLKQSQEENHFAFSAIRFWEVGMLIQKSRFLLAESLTSFRHSALEIGCQEIPLDGGIAVRAAELAGFHKDPADRLITATASVHDAVLVTADRAILGWPGPLDRLDART